MTGRSSGDEPAKDAPPGPGSYGLVDESVSSKYSRPGRMVFGSSERSSLGGGSAAPGPGSYKIAGGEKTTSTGGTPSYSCTPRRPAPEGRMTRDYPGPGSHDVKSPLAMGNDTPGWKLGTDKRRGDAVPFSPGPAAYSPNAGAAMEANPVWGMGTSERKGMALENQAPGPGAYQVRSRVREGLTYSMTARRDDPQQKNAGPGPSAYNLGSTVGEGPKSTMSSRSMWSRKSNALEAADPGPGAYTVAGLETVKTVGPKFGFGTSVRTGMGLKTNAPGPGNYTPRSPAGETSFSYGFGKSLRKGMAKQGGASVPGPGNYAITGTVGGAGGTKVVMTPRRAPIEGKSEAPGPGAYRPGQTDQQTAKWSFGTSQRPQLSQTDPSVPAPGTYSHGKALGSDAPKITIGARLAEPKKDAGGAGGQSWTQFGY